MDFERIAEKHLKRDCDNVRTGPHGIQPVHVFYGGADLFSRDTPDKLGRIALRSIDTYAPDFVTFAKAMWLKGADALPDHAEAAPEIEILVRDEPERAESAYPGAAVCLDVYERTLARLRSRPVEDLRIDFEDGYGFRKDDEEDADASRAARELAGALITGAESGSGPSFGFRIKSFRSETRRRSLRTLEIFLRSLSDELGSELNEQIAVALPKVSSPEEIAALGEMLTSAETAFGLGEGKLVMEAMIETPGAIDHLGEIADAGGARLRGAHFGAYDYTSLLGIASDRQHLHHEMCVLARGRMLNDLAPRGLWLSDSVTTMMPIPVHRGDGLKDWQMRENRRAVHAAWRTHYSNVIRSMSAGFYQSWDLHPSQLAARYAAVYSFYLESANAQIDRLRSFVERATKASITGNAFDDAASAEGILNFLRRGMACGALGEKYVAERTGVSVEHLRGADFAEIARSADG